jgi:2-deoxy-D-gluconate 3-dehydrogenase
VEMIAVEMILATTRRFAAEERRDHVELFDLAGKVAVVTGGNGGIGLGMAKGMNDAGATVVLVGRDEAKAAGALATLNQNARFIAANVTRQSACRALVAEAVKAYGRIDILVNNAGTSIRKRPEAYSEEDWHYVMDTNLTSAFLCSQAVHEEMQKAKGGKIINIGSMMSLFGAPYATPYAASKGGIVQMTRALATAWAADNIQVNAVLPGWIDTDLTRRARSEIDGLHERVLARTPAARWGAPDDLAGVAVFLASRASDFVTGTAIPVDGGFSVSA